MHREYNAEIALLIHSDVTNDVWFMSSKGLPRSQKHNIADFFGGVDSTVITITVNRKRSSYIQLMRPIYLFIILTQS